METERKRESVFDLGSQIPSVKVPNLLRLVRTSDALGWLLYPLSLAVMAMNAFAFLSMVTIDTDLMVILCLNYHVVLIDLCWLFPHHHHSYLTLPPQFWSHPEHWNLTQIVDFSSVLLNDLWMHKKWWHFRFVLFALYIWAPPNNELVENVEMWRMNFMFKFRMNCSTICRSMQNCSPTHMIWYAWCDESLSMSKCVYLVYTRWQQVWRCGNILHSQLWTVKERPLWISQSNLFFYPSLIFLVKQLMVLPMGYNKPLLLT